jgi:hypothetical protein
MKRLIAYLLTLVLPDTKTEQILPVLTLLIVYLQFLFRVAGPFFKAALHHANFRPAGHSEKPAALTY